MNGRERLASAVLLITLAIGIGSKALDRECRPRPVPLPAGEPLSDRPECTEQTFRRLEVNTATVDQLTALPGIGPRKAQAIVEWRELNGRFSTVDDLISVKGIGEKTLASIRAYVYVKDRGLDYR
jgi:competence ComEA-like helix-hairpin-helix protein